MLKRALNKSGLLICIGAVLLALLGSACTRKQAISDSALTNNHLEQPQLLVTDAEGAVPSSQLTSLSDTHEAAGASSPASMTLCKQDGPDVYLVIDQEHRHIVDWDTFLNLGFKQEQIVACDAMAGYPEGAPITRLLKGSGESVYWMESGIRRHIPDMETLHALGFQTKDISIVPDNVLELWPLGEPLPGMSAQLTADTECQTTMLDREIEGWDDGPQRISPDKKWIAFTSNPEGDARIYILKTDGSARTRLDAPATGFPLNSLVWSPNSQYVAFINVYLSQPGGGKIYVAKADGSGLTYVASYVGYFDRIAWSPDSRQLAFTSGIATGHGSGMTIVDYKVYTVNITGIGQPQIALNGCNPVWTP